MLCHPRLPSRRQGSHMQYLFLSEGSCFNCEKHGSSCEFLSIPRAPEAITVPWPKLSQSSGKPGLSCASSIKQLTCFQPVSRFLLRFQKRLVLRFGYIITHTHTHTNSEDKNHRKRIIELCIWDYLVDVMHAESLLHVICYDLCPGSAPWAPLGMPEHPTVVKLIMGFNLKPSFSCTLVLGG